jgi:hypothetical protein
MEVSWGNDVIQVTNVPSQLPYESTDVHATKVIAAGEANPGTRLTSASWEAVALASTHPEAMSVQLAATPDEPNGLLMVEHVEGATLRSVVTRCLMSELFPGIQPRTGMEVLEVPDPQVHGVNLDGRPGAVVRYVYQNPTHLQNHVWQTIHGTLSMNSYATSILTRSVTRNLITHPVEIAFEDGTESFHALVVRDGITRLASAWAVLAGPGSDPADAAALARDALLGGLTAGATGPGLGRRLAKHRGQWRQKLRDEFNSEMDSAEPGVRAAQIAQSYVVPTQIAVGIEGHSGRALSPEDIFDDAIRSVLASVHVEFRQWDTAAQNVEVITRALKRLIQHGDLPWNTTELQNVYGLAVGRISVDEFPQALGGTPTPPGTALWRAVYLVSALTQPDLHDLLKEQAKSIKGDQRMSVKGFGELLGPIIDLPWRSRKKPVTKQARNSWGNGGVLTADTLQAWSPCPTDDFTALIEPAMNGDDDARCTLAVAGGVALIADKLLTRNVGSSLGAPKEKGGVPFRLDTYRVVEGLSRQGNELGLWTLASAANTFRSDDVPRNAVTKRGLIGKNVTESPEQPYQYFKVDLDAPDKIAKDDDGVPVLLYEWDVVAASDPERYKNLMAPQSPAPAASTAPAAANTVTPAAIPSATVITDTDSPVIGGGGSPVLGGSLEPSHSTELLPPPREPEAPLPPSQRAAEHRRALRLGVEQARDALDHLQELEPEIGGHTPLVSVQVLQDLHELLIGIQTDVENLRRRATEESGPDESAVDGGAEEQEAVSA